MNIYSFDNLLQRMHHQNQYQHFYSCLFERMFVVLVSNSVASRIVISDSPLSEFKQYLLKIKRKNSLT